MELKYGEDSLATVLKKIKSLEKNFGVKPADAYNFLCREIDQHNKDNPLNQIKPIGKTSFYDRLKKPVNLTKIFGEIPYRILLKFLDSKGQNAEAQDVDYTKALYAGLEGFINIPSHNTLQAKSLLPGWYRTYRPAIGKEGHAVAGLLHVYEDPQTNALQTQELMRYQPKRDGRKPPCHTFEGMAWFTKGHYFLMTKDSNTKFVQNIILRSLYSDETEEHLEGLYITLTNKGGRGIVCSKIVVQRLHCQPGRNLAWFKALRGTLGYKHPQAKWQSRRIKQSVWERIDPENSENLIRA